MQRLNLAGRRTNFLLQTMGQERVVPAYSLSGVEIAGLETNLFYKLPEVLTQRNIACKHGQHCDGRGSGKMVLPCEG